MFVKPTTALRLTDFGIDVVRAVCERVAVDCEERRVHSVA